MKRLQGTRLIMVGMTVLGMVEATAQDATKQSSPPFRLYRCW